MNPVVRAIRLRHLFVSEHADGAIHFENGHGDVAHGENAMLSKRLVEVVDRYAKRCRWLGASPVTRRSVR